MSDNSVVALRPISEILCTILACAVVSVDARGDDPSHATSREARSILSNNCFLCHGPDAAQREAGLRLDQSASALAELDSGQRAVVPGRPAESALIARITADDEAERMPPPHSGKSLSESEIQLLTDWIHDGAPYAEHWSYRAPQRPDLPAVSDASWPRNEIDHFILARLDREGLRPAAEADRSTLIRRLSLDLTGLPPAWDDVERFVSDARPDAVERLVDRLMAHVTYGEHWARMWLDLARYADSAGYADDPARTIWAYRDWVIRALNDNLPFDQFTIEQLAGDLLSDPTEDQLIATAFHRNTLTNNEGGTNDEEFRNVAVVDRVNTTMAVWMGTTMNCAQCHNHKYDPISQVEFFRMFAILNNTEDTDQRDERPFVEMWTPELRQRKASQEEKVSALQAKFEALKPAALAALSAWEASATPEQLPESLAAVLQKDSAQRSDQERQELETYYLSTAPHTKDVFAELKEARQLLSEIQPLTTVPVMRELQADQQRQSFVQQRGNYLNQGPEVRPGLPAAFHAPPADAPADRLALAQWLVDENNPLTARVIVNRCWEAIFGIGLVRTSEEFGAQGELPSHPLLLDWLATELIRLDWDTKALVRLLVTSAAYRQSSSVTPEQYEQDPDNLRLARGPRFRISAEMIRDQALFVSGLLSKKMYGPPVRPPQPTLGVRAAFGSDVDWEPSSGEDRYRRALYTTWRRSNPYPSLSTFDAPNREVCTVRRARTNTPLQALVTLNDPVYVEAAQALARRMSADQSEVADSIRAGFRLCLARDPNDEELRQLVVLWQAVRERLAHDPEQASRLATEPLGPLPEGADPVELAAWTVVGNVLLNLDEMFLKR